MKPESVGILARSSVWVLAVALAACGGGGSGGGGGNGGGVGEDERTLYTLSPALFTDEAAVVLTAPASVFPDTVALTLSGLAFFGETGDPSSSIGESGQCGLSGQTVVGAAGTEDVMSPYSGALFEVVTIEDLDCREPSTSPEASRAGTITDGVRRLGYPISGEGSDLPADDRFIGYERSGESLEKPFSVVLSDGTESLLHWRRLWDGHIELRRGAGSEGEYGDGGGATRLYQVSELAVGGDDGDVYRLQTGTSEADRFELDFEPRDGHAPQDARTERYQGVYGFELLRVGGQPVADTCPGGRFQVRTTQDLIIEAPENGGSLFGGADMVVSGALAMEDVGGNQASVLYDGVAGTVTVTLNGGGPQVYTYDDIRALRMSRCAP